MKIVKLSLTGFRNYQQKKLEFPSQSSGQVCVVVGRNTAGKTNLLEAIYLLATGESFREGKIEEMVNWDYEVAHVVGEILEESGFVDGKWNHRVTEEPHESQRGQVEVQVSLTRGVVMGKRVSKRRLLVNGVPRSKQKFVGNLVAVSFRPEDMRIVEGSPGRRRNYLDEVLLQVDPMYVNSLINYNQGLKRRNKILQMIRDGRVNRTSLAFWDQLVVKHGKILQDKRQELAEFFNKQKAMNNEQKRAGNFFAGLEMSYKPSVMSEKRLAQYAEEEVMAGHTLVGPHRDDFLIISTNNQIPITKQIQISNNQYPNNLKRNLAIYGPRGEQRLGVLWLKMMAMEYVESKMGVRPVLLLDDIFSELDEAHRELVWGMCRKQQTIITTADKKQIEPLENGYQIIRL